MKKTIYLLSVATLLASGVYAYDSVNQQGMQPGMMQQKMMQGGMMPQKGMMHGMRGGYDGMRMIEQLNLSDEQRHQLSILRAEMKLEMTKARDPQMRQKMQSFMTADSFDKPGFIKAENEMHAKMVALKASHMEKVFTILTKEQRAELKELMGKRPIKAMPPKQS